MAKRLKNSYYVSKHLFIADMKRMMSNCRIYNEPDTEYYRCANTLEKFFFSKCKDHKPFNYSIFLSLVSSFGCNLVEIFL